MGQYYKVLTTTGKRSKVYDRSIIINGEAEYTMAKLMEHSWWGNAFVDSFCRTIYKKQRRVVWMGDYANDYIKRYPGSINGYSEKLLAKLYKKTWRKGLKNNAIEMSMLDLAGKFIVNHTKLQYIDCSQYYKRNVFHGDWCIHPLPIMTCLGNGLGGGDFSAPTDDTTYSLVGTWAYDVISIEDYYPVKYEEIKPVFKEKGWD